MTMVMERLPHCSTAPQKTGFSRLRAAVSGWFGSSAGQPTRLEPDCLSRYLLKDIGLGSDRSGGFDPRADRSGMNWPMR